MRLLVVEDDDGIAEPLVAGLRREGFEVRAGGQRARRPRRRRAGPRAPRPAAARHRRLRGGPRDEGALAGADHHGHRQGRGGRPRHRPRARRRRLRREALRDAGAGGPDQRRHAAGVRERRTLRARPGHSWSAPSRSTAAGTRCGSTATEVSAHAQGVRPPGVARRPIPGAALDRRRILEDVWGTRWYGPSKTIDVHVSSLRRKLGDPAGSRPSAGWASGCGRHDPAAGRDLSDPGGGGARRARDPPGHRLRAQPAPRPAAAGRARRRGAAALVEDTLQAGTTPGDPALTAVVNRYSRSTGARVVVVGPRGRLARRLRHRARARPRLLDASRDRLGARGIDRHRHAPLGDPRHEPPVRRGPGRLGGEVHGAVRVSVPTSRLDSLVIRYWLVLGGVALVVLGAVAVAGRWLALWVSTAPHPPARRHPPGRGGRPGGARRRRRAGRPRCASSRAPSTTWSSRLDLVVGTQEQFVADASHQLRSPLTALRLRIENLQHEVSPAVGDELESAIGEVDRLSRLVNGLLTLAHADRRAPERTRQDVGRLVAERADAWRFAAAERGVEIAEEIADDLWSSLSPGALEQVLDNLIANALEAAPRRHGGAAGGGARGRRASDRGRRRGPRDGARGPRARLRPLLARPRGPRWLRARTRHRQEPGRGRRRLGDPRRGPEAACARSSPSPPRCGRPALSQGRGGVSICRSPGSILAVRLPAPPGALTGTDRAWTRCQRSKEPPCSSSRRSPSPSSGSCSPAPW